MQSLIILMKLTENWMNIFALVCILICIFQQTEKKNESVNEYSIIHLLNWTAQGLFSTPVTNTITPHSSVIAQAAFGKCNSEPANRLSISFAVLPWVVPFWSSPRHPLAISPSLSSPLFACIRHPFTLSHREMSRIYCIHPHAPWTMNTHVPRQTQTGEGGHVIH